MGIIGRQFGHPSGLLGSITGRFMARNNGDFNRWVVAQAFTVSAPKEIVEVGPGPGVGTAALLQAAPEAVVTAVDPSKAMIRQLVRRNGQAFEANRLRTVAGGVFDLEPRRSCDLLMAVHVLYFWTDPVAELRHICALLRPGGVVALGYQLRADMPTAAQRDFPKEGHRLYDADQELIDLVRRAGLEPEPILVMGSNTAPTGRLLMARRPAPAGS